MRRMLKYDNLLLALSIAVFTFMLMNAVKIIAIGKAHTNKSNNYYTSCYLLKTDRIALERLEELSQKAKDNNVNCCIDGVYFQVGNLFDKMNVTMYLNKNLENKWNQVVNSITVGNATDPFVIQHKGNDFLSLENKNYLIYSKINQEIIEDDSILMNWRNLSNDYKRGLIKKLNTIDS